MTSGWTASPAPATPTSKSDQIPVSSLTPFLIITFGIAWGIIALYIFLPTQMAAAFGEISGQHPLFYLATYAPAIAAMTIILARCRWAETQHFLGRLLMWRTSAAWYAFLLLGVPLLFYSGALWKGLSLSEMVPVSSVGGDLVALALFAIKGPVEETGWRGLALPLLQRKMAPIRAGLALGVVWFNRDAMLRGTDAVTHVVPSLPTAEPDAPPPDRRARAAAPATAHAAVQSAASAGDRHRLHGRQPVPMADPKRDRRRHPGLASGH